MKQINYEYTNRDDLEKFIRDNFQSYDQKKILVQLFSSNTLYMEISRIKNELQSLLENASIITSSTAGIVHDGKISDDKIILSFSVFENSTVKNVGYYDSSTEEIINDLKNNYITGDTKLVITFANTFKVDASDLLSKLAVVNPDLVVVGGNAGDDFKFHSNYISANNSDDSDIVFAIIDSKVLKVNADYLFNWETIGKEMLVTKASGPTVYELDNMPIIDTFEKYLGKTVRDDLLKHGSQFPLVLNVGGTEVARALVAFNYEEGSITFAGNVPEGQYVRFGFADLGTIEHKNIEHIKLHNQKVNEATFVYTCGARRQMLGGFLNKEIQILNSLGTSSGFITYGEFFHNSFSCDNNLLNITTTYVTLNEREDTSTNLDIKIVEEEVSDDEIRLSALTTLIKETSKDLDENIYYLEQFKNAVASASIFSTTDRSGIITDVNTNFEMISGYKRDEIVGRPHNIVRHPDNDPKLFKEMWQTIQSGKIWKGLIKNRTKKGTDYWVVSEVAPIYYKDGTFREYIGIRNDVTKLETVKQILQNEVLSSKENLEENLYYFKQYEEAINLSTAVLRTDVNNNIKYVNDRFLELSKYKRKELIGKNCGEIRHRKHQEVGLCTRILNDLNSKQIVKEVITNVAKDKSEFITKTIFYPVTNKKNEIVEFIQVMFDVTDIYRLNDEIVNTQKEVVEKMGAIGETRSKETGDHVRRVAEYSYMLAKYYGLSEKEAILLKQASPMHDIGKVGIPDAILNKPGKLTPEEFEIMKTHAEIGYEMLKHSERDILKASAMVAYTHHEKWNGSGYPQGTQGNDIHIFGRITAVADVFDALGHDRVYKKAWELDKILELFKEERGKHFDPTLIDLFFDNLDSFLEVKNRFDSKPTEEN
ncbi:HD domain-containing phosphohydrolase [Sulfurimonas sp. C5]|uniref:HD domain-containing phosphohydrolase n=1 Tax=Sulfurimonas sp. C5 TaxID=3036947 RepID=UPI002456F9E4|nr:HD domain-containing phosphohydrolase [Sulfurimonas sp. C5]MDH4944583.1 PAS domain S-box protein [Sulfurimonas sp. C5]